MTQVDDTTIITTDEDILLEDEPNEESHEDQGMIESIAETSEEDGLETQELPIIEVDEWLDLDEQWEKDTFFVVFSKEELYRNAYLLYYQESKDETFADHQAKIKVKLLQDVLAILSKRGTYKIPSNLYPIVKAERKDISDNFENYLKQYKQLRRKPYLDSQQKLNKLYTDIFEFNTSEEGVFIITSQRIEAYFEKEVEKEQEEPTKKKKKGRGKRERDEDANDGEVIKILDTYVSYGKDEQPLPIKGFFRRPFYSADNVPLYLSELVKWKHAKMEDYEKILISDDKKALSLKNLKEYSKYSYEDVIDGLKELPSLHNLHVLLASFGYYLETLTETQLEQLYAKLESLRKNEKSINKNTPTRILWSHYPRKMVLPSEYSLWTLLKELFDQLFDKNKTTIETLKDKVQHILREYETHQEVFSKTASVPMNIYDIAMQIHEKNLTIEEVIETLTSIRNEEALVTYIDFLKGFANNEWDYEALSKFIDEKHKEWTRMDASIVPERKPILTTYDASQEIVKGKRSFPIEEHDTLLNIGDVEEDRDRIDITLDDTLDPNIAEVIPFIDESSQDVIAPHVQKASYTNGQKEVFSYVLRLLIRLQEISELPLPIEKCLEDLKIVTSRLSQIEELQQLVPEIPSEELRKVFDQQITHIEITDSELEERFKKSYVQVVHNYRKSIVETFFFALTWWVVYLQEEYITNPRNVQPGFQPCLPVWAFYGTPMSSSDEKGVAKYITCIIEYIRQQESNTIWQIIDNYTEKHIIDKVYKISKNEFFQMKVAMLKEEWKNKWKDIARKDKEREVYVDQLTKASSNPQKYRHVYVELLKRLPKILYEKQLATKQYIAIPVANSCCAQPLNNAFQAYGDLKGTILYEHRKLHFGRQAEYKEIGENMALGKVVTGEFGTSLADESCGEDLSTKLEVKDTIDTISKRQWNRMCLFVRQQKWMVPTKSETDDAGIEKEEYIETLSTSDIRKSLRDYQQMVERIVSNDNKQWQIFTQLLQSATWNEKMQVLTLVIQSYQKDILSNMSSSWIPEVSKRNIEQLVEWRKELSTWRYPSVLEANVHDMMNYVIMMAITLPLIPSIDSKSLTGRLDGIDLQVLDQRWLNESIDRRIGIIASNRKIQKTPTMKEIQEYYANVREKLKENNLAEYKTKSIDEIQEIREAKKLGVKKILDTLDTKYTGVFAELVVDTSTREVETDDTIDNEGLAEYRFEGFNADSANIERID